MLIKVKCYFPAGILKLATQNYQDASGNWQNKIIDLSSLSRNIGEDKSYEISGVTITMNDSDRFFRNMMSGEKRYIAGQNVEILEENNAVIYTGTVEKWEFKEGTFTIHINDRQSGLDQLIPETLTKKEYPDAAEEADGTSIPLIYGYLHAPTGAVKCWKVDSGKYLVASHKCQALEQFFKEDGTDISDQFTWDYDTGPLGTEERYYALYDGTEPFEDNFIRVNVYGKMNAAETELIEHPMVALEDIVNNYSNMTLSSMNRQENIDLMTGRNYKIATVIHNQKTLKDILKEFSFSFDSDFYITKAKEIAVTLLSWDVTTPAKVLDQNQISSFQLQELPEEIRNKIKYKYRRNYADGKYQREPLFEKAESIANWGEFYNRNEALEFGCVYDEETVTDVIQRYAFQRRNPRRMVSLEMPLEEYVGLDIADIIEVSHPDAIDEKAGQYQVRRVDIDFIADRVSLECLDLGGISGSIFILGDISFTDDWEKASFYEKQFAYLCGGDGYFANGIDEGKVLY
jgi:hypothetical protein